MPSWEDPDHFLELQHFHHFVATRCQQGIGSTEDIDIGSRFLPTSDLETYFDDDGEKDRLRDILNRVLPSPGPPLVDPSAIQSEYLKVFAILLCIGKGRFIVSFVVHPGLSDSHLPFRQRPPDFPTSPDFFDVFFKKQWMFCAPDLQYASYKTLAAGTILPITSRELIGTGGDADVYKIVTHPSYNKLHVNSETPLDRSDPLCDTFVLKSYHSDAEAQYRREVDGFVSLRTSLGRTFPCIIGFHGSFTHNGTHNVLLEYANEGTLEDYFKRVTPPSTGPEIYTFWSGLLSLIKVLAGLHRLPFDNSVYVGFHQDITPRNILVCWRQGKSIYECDFKLADLGLSHIHPGENAQGEDARGTRTYGAPELYREDSISRLSRRRITPAADVWSLGCVFSEAAVWLVHGMEGTRGLRNYRKQRTEEAEQTASSEDPGCFHDGEGVLECVAVTHTMLPRDLRRSDSLTEAVLDMIHCMLEPEGSRISSATLQSIATRKLQKSNAQDLSIPVPATPVSFGEGRIDGTHPEPDSREPGISKGKHPEENDFVTLLPAAPASPLCTVGNSPDGPSSLPSLTWLSGSSPLGDGLQTRYNHDRAMVAPKNEPHGSPENFQHPVSRISPDAASPLCSLGGIPALPQLKIGNVPIPTRGTAANPTLCAPELVVDHVYCTSEPSSVYSGPVLSTSSKLLPHCRSVDNLSPGALAPPATENPNVEPPVLSVSDAQKWRDGSRGRRGFDEAIKQLPHGYLRGELDDRDHVFILDNSTSMAPHWPDLVKLLDIMAYIVKKADPNGVDVYLAIDPDRKHHKRSRRTRELVEFANKHCPAPASADNRRFSNISSRLDSILQDYRTRWEDDITRRQRNVGSFFSTSKTTPKLSLYIFTDGSWSSQPGFDHPIRSMVRKLDELDKSEDQIGVQFIRFGDDEGGKKVLNHLDSGLRLTRDIVDTEPFEGGNVWKMLLGSINRWWDGDPVTSVAELDNSGAVLVESEAAG